MRQPTDFQIDGRIDRVVERRKSRKMLEQYTLQERHTFLLSRITNEIMVRYQVQG